MEWRRAGGGGHSGRVIAGRLTFGRVAKSDEGEYFCSVTSADGRRAQEARTMLYVRDRGVFEVYRIFMNISTLNFHYFHFPRKR